MQMDFNELGGCRRELKVEFAAEEVQAKFKEVVAEYAKYGRVNGFRPGRAPEAMVRRQYAKHIAKDVHDRLFGEGYRGALAQHKFVHVADLDFREDKVEDGKPYSFSLTMEVAPTVDISSIPYKGLPADAPAISVSDDEVASTIDRVLKERGSYQDAPEGTPVQEDDIVSIDYEATLDGHPLAEGLDDKDAADLASGKNRFMRAADGFSPIPGIGPKLVGMPAGETRDVEIAFDDAFRVEALRGKTATYKVTVGKIRRLVPRALDEDFIKSQGATDEADFRAKVREALETNLKEAEVSRIENALRDALLDKAGFDVPSKEIELTKNRIVYQIVNENARRGVPEEVIRKGIDQITATADKEAASSLRIKYLYSAIAKAEKISVSNYEVNALLAGRGKSPQAALKDMARESGADEETIRSDIRATILRTKIERFLLENAAWTGDGAAAVRDFLGLGGKPAGDAAKADA